MFILDIYLPGETGICVIKYVSAKETKPLIVILINFLNENNKRCCLELGTDYFFDITTEFEQSIDVLKNTQGGIHE